MLKRLFFSVFFIYLCVNQIASAQTTEVISLKSAVSQQWVGGGQTGYYQSYYVRVKNIGFSKKVFIHYKDTNGVWKDLPLTFSDHYKNYDVFSTGSGSVQGDVEFVIRYEVNGQVYWNNNGGRNYFLPRGQSIIGGNVTMWNLSLLRYSCAGWMGACIQAHIYGNIHVKNLAPNKNVGVRCSYDNGSTWFNVTASYAYSVPLSNGTEVWTIDSNSKIISNIYADATWQCAAFYDNYWDNNFGQNYKLKADTSGNDEIQ
jgi:Carbohydrate/starch-binding module (family 21)